MERKKGRSGSSRIILIHSNVSNQMMMLIHSNVSKFFKKQHTNSLYCFAKSRSLDESSNSTDEKFFLKEIEITSICVFKRVRKIYVCRTSFTLKKIKLLCLRSVVDQIFNTSFFHKNRSTTYLTTTPSKLFYTTFVNIFFSNH